MNSQNLSHQLVDEVIRRLPFRVLVIQTDNGAEFQPNFHWHLEERDELREREDYPRLLDDAGLGTKVETGIRRESAQKWLSTTRPPSLLAAIRQSTAKVASSLAG